MSSRSGRGDPRANGDIDSLPPPRNAPVIPIPPDPNLLRTALEDNLLWLQQRVDLRQQHLTPQQKVQETKDIFLWLQQQVDLRKQARLAATIQSSPVFAVPTLEKAPHNDTGVDVTLGIQGRGGSILQPHTDGVLALPIAGVPASPEPSPRVTSVGDDNLGTENANGASPALGIGKANTDGGTIVGIAPVPGENNAAPTAPTNQQQYLRPSLAPNRMLTRYHLRNNATKLQKWFRHHSIRCRCVL